jgi:hypothetical protein
MIPEGFPKWYTVYSYFAKWSQPDPDGTSAGAKIDHRTPRERCFAAE